MLVWAAFLRQQTLFSLSTLTVKLRAERHTLCLQNVRTNSACMLVIEEGRSNRSEQRRPRLRVYGTTYGGVSTPQWERERGSSRREPTLRGISQ